MIDGGGGYCCACAEQCRGFLLLAHVLLFSNHGSCRLVCVYCCSRYMHRFLLRCVAEVIL